MLVAIGILFGVIIAWGIVATIVEVIKEKGFRGLIGAVCIGAVVIGIGYVLISGSGGTGSDEICIARDAYGCIE